MRASSFGFAFVACAAVSTAAWAGDPDGRELAEARELFGSAQADEDAGRWAQALNKLERAIRIKGTPGLRFHIGHAKEQLGLLADALSDYEESRRLAEAEKTRDVLAAVELRWAAVTERVPTLKISTNATKARAAIDGRLEEPFSKPIRLNPGFHRIDVEAPGFVSAHKELLLHEKEHVRLELFLAPTASDSPSGFQTEGGPAAREATGSGVTAAILATVGATTLALGGFVAFALAAHAKTQGEDCDRGLACSPNERAGRSAELQDRVRALDWTALGLWAGGLGLGITSVVLWTYTANHRPSVQVAVQPAAGGLSLRGSF